MSDPPSAAGRERRLDWLVVAVALGVLAFFLVVYPVFGYRVAIGSDTPVYVWWARRAGALGLSSSNTGGRPGLVGSVAVLSEVLRVPAAWLAAALAPALAAVAGLAGGAFAERSLGHDRARFAIGGFLVGIFLTNLVPGYLSTLAFLGLTVAALAVVAGALANRGWGPILGAGMLGGAAILSHPLFTPLGAVVLAGGVLALRPWVRASGADRQSDRAAGIGRLAGATAVAVVLGGAGIALTAGGVHTTVDTSRDAALARLGLSSLVRRSYRTVLANAFPWWRALALAALAALPLWLRPRPWEDPKDGAGTDPTRFFWGVLVAWLVVTAVGVTALLAGTSAPGQRLAEACLAIPLLAAIGLRGVPARLRLAGLRGRWPLAAAAVGVVAFAALLWPVWADNGPLALPATLEEARAAGAVLAATPDGTPLILVMDPAAGDTGRFVIRTANYVRGAVPPERALDVHVFVGSPEDFLAGRPTLTGQAEHDALARDAWDHIEPLRSSMPLAVVLRSVDPAGYDAARSLPAVMADPSTYAPAPGVVLLPGSIPPAAASPAAGSSPSNGAAGAGPMSPWTPIWLGPAVLLLLGAVGWPWAVAGLGGSSRSLRPAVAPAAGLGAVSLAAVAVDAAGLRLSGGGAYVAVGGALLAGLAAAGLASRTRSRAASS
jgi:hypothetical protein